MPRLKTMAVEVAHLIPAGEEKRHTVGRVDECRCEPTRGHITFSEDGTGAIWHKVTAVRHGHLPAS